MEGHTTLRHLWGRRPFLALFPFSLFPLLALLPVLAPVPLLGSVGGQPESHGHAGEGGRKGWNLVGERVIRELKERGICACHSC